MEKGFEEMQKIQKSLEKAQALSCVNRFIKLRNDWVEKTKKSIVETSSFHYKALNKKYLVDCFDDITKSYFDQSLLFGGEIVSMQAANDNADHSYLCFILSGNKDFFHYSAVMEPIGYYFYEGMMFWIVLVLCSSENQSVLMQEILKKENLDQLFPDPESAFVAIAYLHEMLAAESNKSIRLSDDAAKIHLLTPLQGVEMQELVTRLAKKSSPYAA